MDFLAYLNDYESQDVSGVKDIVESRSAKHDNVLKEAFNSDFPSKREALFNVENYFTNSETAPECVDTKYVKENISEIKEQIKNLSEGDIRIIIHNHEDGKKEVEVTEEGATPKRKPGRPKGSKGKKAVQTDFTKAPKGTTAVIYDEDETDKDSPVIEEDGFSGIGEQRRKEAINKTAKFIDSWIEQGKTYKEIHAGVLRHIVNGSGGAGIAGAYINDVWDVLDMYLKSGKINDTVYNKKEESVDDTLFDKKTKSKVDDSKEQIDEEETNIKWSDIVDAVSDEEEGKEPEEDGIDDKLIKDLADLDLTDEELKEIVDNVSAEDRGAKIDKAMDIMRKINKK